MVQFTTTILQFVRPGDKNGWTYIEIPSSIAQKLKPGNKKSFRVKGKLDDYPIKSISLMPMGQGNFMMALKSSIRKAIQKNKGAKILVQIEVDNKKLQAPAELITCLKDEPEAYSFFKQLSYSHQNYFGNWIRTAKTAATKSKRIAHCVTALSRKMDFGQMLRSIKKDKDELLNREF